MTSKKLITLVAVAVAALLAGGAVMWIVRAVSVREVADVAAQTEASDEDRAAARMALQSRFPQATAIIFGKAFVHGDGDASAVCGEVDVEQPDDGYDGAERFVYVAGELTLAETDGDAAVDQKWKDACEG